MVTYHSILLAWALRLRQGEGQAGAGSHKNKCRELHDAVSFRSWQMPGGPGELFLPAWPRQLQAGRMLVHGNKRRFYTGPRGWPRGFIIPGTINAGRLILAAARGVDALVAGPPACSSQRHQSRTQRSSDGIWSKNSAGTTSEISPSCEEAKRTLRRVFLFKKRRLHELHSGCIADCWMCSALWEREWK